jgi:hypothetical protein
MRIPIATTLLALGLTGCANSQLIEPIADPVPNGIVAGTLEARVEGTAVVLRNTTEFVVTYRLIESETATRALYPVCTVATCSRLAQGESRTVPLTSIDGWSAAARSAIVPWWRMVPQRDGSLVAQPGGEAVRLQL